MSQQGSGSPPSGWAIGGITFAVVMMTMIGVFQVIAGLVAIFNDDFYVVTQNYTFDLDTTAYGWIHLLLGILLLLAGYGLYSGRDVGGGARDRDGGPGRDRELLLHPVLPVLVDPRDRPLRLGDLGADPDRLDNTGVRGHGRGTRAHRLRGAPSDPRPLSRCLIGFRSPRHRGTPLPCCGTSL